MNTFNLLNAIALLACISTPAYVIYYLKYFIREKINTLEENLNDVDLEISNHDSHIAEINYERSKELHDINELINQLESQLKLAKSNTKNKFENLHVDMNYLKRTLNDDMSKVNERIDLTNAIHKNTIDKIQDKVFKKYDVEWTIQKNFNSNVHNQHNLVNKQIDSLQSLNITTQSILKRINSKEFASEVLLAWMNKLKQEKDAKDAKDAKEAQQAKTKPQSKEKKKSSSTSNSNLTKPSESVQNEVVNIIKEDVNKKRRRGRPAKQTIPSPAILEQEVVVVVKEKKINKPKADSKRVISNRELEIFFKEQTQLTYRGFVIKYGQDAFKRAKQLIYKRLHYYKYAKYQKSINTKK
jgi:hypothetical protein